MKGYKQLISERYDGSDAVAADGESCCDPLAPTGEYLWQRGREELLQVALQMRASGLDWCPARVRDFGCGSGATLRFLLELCGDPDHLGGAELSAHRRVLAGAICRRIEFIHRDIEVLSNDTKSWDVVMAWAMWMQLPGLGSPPAAQRRMVPA